MSNLHIYTGGYQGSVGISIRGNCTEPKEIMHLQQALGFVLEIRSLEIWIDCRQLESLSSQAQRALLQLDRQARKEGIKLHWCGLPSDVATHLTATGLAEVLSLLPAQAYRGPQDLLLEEVPTTSRIMAFQPK
ncbi:STAS domain-containing protein [Hymenobacter sp. BT730]|uniref:STAS domain-containing protein n=1 Tax=Hymenobacter sp. BT730 TaxID=3063332 RepID=UPI0026DF3C2D|nr:STAS domain-containing protein [Hymenobacter sp. BT730]